MRNHQNICFLTKNGTFFGATPHVWRFCKNGACGRRATGGLLLGLSEEQQGGLLLPGLAPGRIYSVCNVGLGLSEEQQGGLLLPGLAPGRIYSVCNVGCWRTIRSEAFDEFGTTCTLQSLTNNECSVATGPGGDATSHVAILERSITAVISIPAAAFKFPFSVFSSCERSLTPAIFCSAAASPAFVSSSFAHARYRYDTFDVNCCHVFPLLIGEVFEREKLSIKISLAFSRTLFFLTISHALITGIFVGTTA